MLVVLGAADLVDRLAAELDDVEGVEHDLGVRDAVLGADCFLIAGGHVDRDGLDRRLLLVCETVEERLQAGGVPALGRPHDPAAVVVGDAGQELVISAVGDLVDADQLQPVQTSAGQLLATTRVTILPTVSQPIRISLVTCVWLICCASHA